MQSANTIQQSSPSRGGAPRAGSASLIDLSTRLGKAKLLFLLAAGLSFLFSVSLWFLVDREQGLFVGIWVPSILALGALLLSGKEEKR